MAAETLLKHPTLGEIRGKAKDRVVQFLGLKYASLENRLAEPELVTSYSIDGGVDATKLGPGVVSPPQGCDMEFGFIQHSLPKPDHSVSELDGLNLNITVPIAQSKRLPTLVFIHGGGFSIGGNWWPQFDLARFVKLSAELGMPLIGVGINYRLGMFGLLNSEELRKAGYKGNRSLRDQRTALLWIRKHIEGFGGDADNVTVVGQSAGGVSASLLLHSVEPLFKRLACLGGSSLLIHPIPPPVQEHAYTLVLQALGLDQLSETERIKGLLEAPIDDVLSKISPTVPFLPVVDDDLIPAAVTFEQVASKSDAGVRMPGRRWCDSLLIGDCQFDGMIFAYMIEGRKAGIAGAFARSIRGSLEKYPQEADNLLKAYNIVDGVSDDAAFVSILKFATDIGFLASTLTFAKGWPGRANVYHFNVGNPWDGPWKGETTHILDVAFLFQNYNEFLSHEDASIARKFAEDFISFANGKSPYSAFTDSAPGVMVYGPSRAGVHYAAGSDEANTGRRSTIFQFAATVGLDTLSAAWGNFMAEK